MCWPGQCVITGSPSLQQTELFRRRRDECAGLVSVLSQVPLPQSRQNCSGVLAWPVGYHRFSVVNDTTLHASLLDKLTAAT